MCVEWMPNPYVDPSELNECEWNVKEKTWKRIGDMRIKRGEL